MRVLIVEDDGDLATQIADMLRGDNFAVDLADNGPDALALGLDEPYDAVILDPGLPGMDGISVLKRWRGQGRSMPVIVLTASRKDVADMKEAVKAGATNYLTKPVDLELLLDWVRGVANSAGPNVSQTVLEAGPLRMDTQAMRVWFDGAPARLTPTEFRILHYLLVYRQRPVSAEELVQHNFDGASIKTTNEIPVYVSRLRDKLGKSTIETVLGYGYRLACGDS